MATRRGSREKSVRTRVDLSKVRAPKKGDSVEHFKRERRNRLETRYNEASHIGTKTGESNVPIIHSMRYGTLRTIASVADVSFYRHFFSRRLVRAFFSFIIIYVRCFSVSS